jgi:hypothetical protein
LLEGNRIDKDEEKSLQYRLDALNTIIMECDFEGLINVVKRVKYPEILGEILTKRNLTPEEIEKLFALLEEENKSIMIFVQTYISHKAFNDDEWIRNLVEKAQTENWPDIKVVNCFIAFPSRMNVWDYLNSFDNKIQELYWKKCRFGGITKATEDKNHFLKQMVNVKRYFTALDIAALYYDEVHPELIAEILEKAATKKSIDEFRIEYWDIERLFNKLYESEYPENEIAKLEWYYLLFLTSVGSGRSPKLLHNELASNPTFFAEVIRNVYKRKDEKQDKDQEKLPDELLEQRATLSWNLLHSWNTVPGLKSGKINYEVLKSWIVKARELCEKSDRIDVCDKHIGKLLVFTELENDIWPPEAVCRIIEDIESEKLNNSFEIGISNNRGIVTKSLEEGGKQEIELCKKYKDYADKLNTRFPKTASILYDVAEDYKNQSKKEDEEVEIRDLEN